MSYDQIKFMGAYSMHCTVINKPKKSKNHPFSTRASVLFLGF